MFSGGCGGVHGDLGRGDGVEGGDGPGVGHDGGGHVRWWWSW